MGQTEPAAFNPDYRPGFGRALSREFEAYCEANPRATREELAAVYNETAARLAAQFPSHRWELVPGESRYWRRLTDEGALIYNYTSDGGAPGENWGGYANLDALKSLKGDL